MRVGGWVARGSLQEGWGPQAAPGSGRRPDRPEDGPDGRSPSVSAAPKRPAAGTFPPWQGAPDAVQ